MRQETIPTGDKPEVTFNIDGHLKIDGWERSEVEITCADEGDLNIDVQESVAHIHANRDATVRVPFGATVRLERVRKNATVRNIQGPLWADRINGNLTLSDVYNVDARHVEGNLVAVKTRDLRCLGAGGNGNLRDIAGDSELAVGGNLDARQITGQFSGTAGGNLDITDVQGDISGTAGGNAGITLTNANPGQIRVNAGGNINTRLGTAVNANILASDHRGTRKFTLGDGGSQIHLSCGGGVTVVTDSGEINWEPAGQRGGRKQLSMPLGASKQVFVEAGENVRVTGHDGVDVIAEKYGLGFEFSEREGQVHASSGSHTTLLVPNGSTIHIEAGMNATVRDFSGHVEMECGCDAKVRNMTGSLKIEAGSSANVVFMPSADSESNIEAGAEVRCRLIEPANATVNIEDMRGERERIFGDGSAKIHLAAGASVSVGIATEDENAQEGGFSFSFNSDDFAQKMGEFGEKMSGMAREFSERFDRSGMPTWLADEMSGMQGRIEETMRRATEKVNRKVESAIRRTEKRNTRRGPTGFAVKVDWDDDPPVPPVPPEPPHAPFAPEPPAPPVPPTPKASSDERMMILRMLEQKKITVEEASTLLAALN